MRVSTAYQYRVYTDNIRAAQERTFEAQRRIMTGKRVDRMSDDPIAGAQILTARGIQQSLDQYSANLRSAKDYLGSSEIAVTEINNVLRNAYQSAVRAANGVYDQESRDALANDIASMQKRLVELGNSKGASGQYIFAGHRTDSQTFTVSGSALTFNGDFNNVNVESGPGETLSVNSHLGSVLSQAYTDLENLRTNLIGGNLGAISGLDIPALQSRMADFRKELALIGSKSAKVKEIESHNIRRKDDLTSQIADLEEVDMAATLTEYQAAQTAYQAAMQTAASGFGLSLLDFLR